MILLSSEPQEGAQCIAYARRRILVAVVFDTLMALFLYSDPLGRLSQLSRGMGLLLLGLALAFASVDLAMWFLAKTKPLLASYVVLGVFLATI